MKTETLIEWLAQDNQRSLRMGVWRRLALALLLGDLLALLLLIATLPLRTTFWTDLITMPMLWLKLGFSLTLAVLALLAVRRLSTPGMKLAHLPLALLGPVLGIWAAALLGLSQTPRLEWPRYALGDTWWVCPWLIAMLALPIFLCTLWAMRQLAVTRPTLAGGCAGLFSGAMAAAIYSLHCPEQSPLFVSTWYLLGILIPALLGLWLGQRLLRW